ncbi:hypothetical protein Lal_00014677, partial [Lupinus albus]
MDVISLLHGSRPNHHNYMAIEISINHILREGNSCADFLAKKGATSTYTFTILEYVPSKLKHMLFSNAIGTRFASFMLTLEY